MKTNDKDIEKMCLDFINLSFNFEMCGNAEKKMFIDDSLKVYKAGFKACEAKMLAEASEGFKEFVLNLPSEVIQQSKNHRDFNDPQSMPRIIWEAAHTAGAMSQAKRVNELKETIAELESCLFYYQKP
jgi:hypothetical protein